MQTHFSRTLFTIFSLLISVAAYAADAPSLSRIEKLTGLKGQLISQEGVVRVSYPRSDLHPVAEGVKLTPAMGLTAWVSFQGSGDHVMAMGDLVLQESEVTPVMTEALDQGLEVTALHNHFFYDKPKIMFMHVSGMGEEEKLAAAVGKVFAKLKEAAKAKPASVDLKIDPRLSSLNTLNLEKVFGKSGEMKDGVLKFTFGRTIQHSGHDIGSAMGVNTWAAFAGLDDKAVVDGDFCMKESELQPTLKALRAGGIQIVAIHNHMTGEDPRTIFLHYWGVGPSVSLAKTIQSALALQK